MTLALGIDVGTSGVRTAVLEGTQTVSVARANHPVQTGANVNANDWWTAVAECLQCQVKALAKLGRDPRQILRIAVDGTSGSMVLTDASLEPVGPALMYNSKGFDAEAERIANFAPSPHITNGSNSALARAMRLIELSEADPVHLLHQADFIGAKLTGIGGHSDYNNSLKLGFDPESELWPSWIGEVIKPNLLPKVHAPGAALYSISKHIAAQFGLSPSATVHAGTTDSIAAFLASAPLEEGVAVTSLGSTLAVKLLSKKRIDDPEIGLYSHRLGDLWLVGGASNTGGAVLRSYFSDDELMELSSQIDPNMPQDLGYYPLLEPGERFPINDPDLQPKVVPRPDTDADFLQALLEGIAQIEAECYAAIVKKGGSRPSQIITAGGGAKNRTWTKIRSLALGMMPVTTRQTEASVGAAKLPSLV